VQRRGGGTPGGHSYGRIINEAREDSDLKAGKHENMKLFRGEIPKGESPEKDLRKGRGRKKSKDSGA